MIQAPSIEAAAAANESTHSPQSSLLRMAVGSELLAVPIEAVREILEVGRLTPLPRTPDFVRGVMNLRGAVVPVVDLPARIGQGATTLGRRSCIVVVEVCTGDAGDGDGDATYGQRLVIGLLVDAVYEVFDIDTDSVEPVPALGTRVRPDFLSGMTRARGEVIGVLALPHVLSATDLADAIAAHQAH